MSRPLRLLLIAQIVLTGAAVVWLGVRQHRALAPRPAVSAAPANGLEEPLAMGPASEAVTAELPEDAELPEVAEFPEDAVPRVPDSAPEPATTVTRDAAENTVDAPAEGERDELVELAHAPVPRIEAPGTRPLSAVEFAQARRSILDLMIETTLSAHEAPQAEPREGLELAGWDAMRAARRAAAVPARETVPGELVEARFVHEVVELTWEPDPLGLRLERAPTRDASDGASFKIASSAAPRALVLTVAVAELDGDDPEAVLQQVDGDGAVEPLADEGLELYLLVSGAQAGDGAVPSVTSGAWPLPDACA